MSQPRIIAGKARGIRLKSVPGDSTRPITDNVKEALFNILGADIIGSDFLDVFGGTGSVGIEALSRGAAYALFLDINRQAIKTIQANLKACHLEEHARIIQTDALTFLRKPPDHTFHYTYIAPPQYKGMWKQTLEVIDANPGWMTSDAWVIVQIHPIEYESVDMTHIREFSQRKYGSTLLVFYERG